MKKFTLAILCCFTVAACAPEVGTKEWCDQLKDKPKGDWTASEAADYTKHCLFK
ncbi:DUF3012 domain-containing protein [Thalassotalea piscium]